jgi:hypothetical protein
MPFHDRFDSCSLSRRSNGGALSTSVQPRMRRRRGDTRAVLLRSSRLWLVASRRRAPCAAHEIDGVRMAKAQTVGLSYEAVRKECLSASGLAPSAP